MRGLGMSHNDPNNLANELLAGNFTKSTQVVSKLTDPLVPTPMVVTLDQLRTYESNPRIKKNPRYDELRASILHRGFDATPQITRRPDQEHYIVRNGFNTRLAILNELWKETKDEQFYKILCLFHPWSNEITVLTGHLTENDLRGDLTFIERALAVKKATELYESEAGRGLAQREIAELLTKDGYPVKQAQISRMQDTVEFLLPVIPNALYSGMSNYQIQRLLTLRRQAKTVYKKYLDDSNDGFLNIYMDALSQFDDDANSFNFERFKDELIGEMSGVLNTTYNLLALAFDEKSPTMEEQEPDAIDYIDFSTIEIDEAKLFAKPALNLVDLTESEIINIPLPKILRVPDNPIDPTASDVTKNKEHTSSFSNSTVNLNDDSDSEMAGLVAMDFAESEPPPEFSNLSSTQKVDAIKSMIAGMTEEQQVTIFSQPVPVTSGFFPVKDIWLISPELEDIKRLQAHIGQLVFEMADELEVGGAIQLIENKLGFNCIETDANDSANVLLSLLTELTTSSQLAALLVGCSKQNNTIRRLSDNSIIKLFRILRLARKLSELENTH